MNFNHFYYSTIFILGTKNQLKTADFLRIFQYLISSKF
ncbi:hypothetical protein SGADD02_00176 [Streptococcus gallolyticus]|uniref:Uncharacterized protein n=1 Tax=Streptococcus gallolyticus TaxID=315405 RepID=A0A139NC19_9STRE|nr:hypothetical protein SGADD02_00176 [Streptococcus gallolyticus]